MIFTFLYAWADLTSACSICTAASEVEYRPHCHLSGTIPSLTSTINEKCNFVKIANKQHTLPPNHVFVVHFGTNQVRQVA